MKKLTARDTDNLLRLLQGQMSEDEELILRERLEQSAYLREELFRLSGARDWLQDAAAYSAASALDPFFTDRLMRRVNKSPSVGGREEDLAAMLAQVFRPVALASLVLALCLMAYNVRLAEDYSVDTTTAESMLALPPVTSMSAFDLDLYAAESELIP